MSIPGPISTPPPANGSVNGVSEQPSIAAGPLLLGLISLGVWAYAAISTLHQKLEADKLLRDAYDASAVQIQQINGQVTAHAIAMVVLGFAAMAPFLVAALTPRTRR